MGEEVRGCRGLSWVKLNCQKYGEGGSWRSWSKGAVEVLRPRKRRETQDDMFSLVKRDATGEIARQRYGDIGTAEF